MKIERDSDPTINRIKNIIVILLCFSPILVILLATREYFFGYLFYAIQIILMGLFISFIFPFFDQLLRDFIQPSYEKLITSKIPLYYLKFIINAFFLTLAISILFYEEGISFVQYSYPALALLCASRILQYRDGNRGMLLKKFIEYINSFVIIILLFICMRFMGVFSKLEDTSLLAISFVNIPTIKGENIAIFILLSLSVWVMLSMFERLKLVKQK